MERRTSSHELLQKLRPKMFGKSPAVLPKRPPVRPVWLSNSAYFSTSGMISVLFFFLIWGIFSDSKDENDGAWFPAFIAGILIFASAIALHGVLLRRAKHRFLLRNERMSFPQTAHHKLHEKGKLTLEKHAAKLQAIGRKAESADSATSSPEAHLEVYRSCEEYLEQIEAALPGIHAGSPRLAAFRSGQERIRVLQKHHLLKWAGDESRQLLREAQVRVTTNEKVENAQRALEVLDAALQIYPNEPPLIESAHAIHEFIAASYVAYWVELAERAAFKGMNLQAIDHYQDALFYLSRESVDHSQSSATIEHIKSEIARLQELADKEQTKADSLVLPGSETKKRRRKLD